MEKDNVPFADMTLADAQASELWPHIACTRVMKPDGGYLVTLRMAVEADVHIPAGYPVADIPDRARESFEIDFLEMAKIAQFKITELFAN